MSGRQWQPGDVAIVTDGEVEWFGLVRDRSTAARRALEFAYTTGGYDLVNDLAEGFTARPLVVIDPEDREQVERFTYLFLSHHWSADHQTHTDVGQVALRDLANPTLPKPDEPTDLGAVVKDRGEEWVHFGNGCWIKAVPNANLRTRSWNEFSDAVRVVAS